MSNEASGSLIRISVYLIRYHISILYDMAIFYKKREDSEFYEDEILLT